MSEENHDITKGFWIEGVNVPDADGNCPGNHFAGFQGKIKVSLGKPKRESGKHGKHMMMFKTVLPQHAEHEDFFNQVCTNFEMFKDKLEDFFETMNPKTIDSHISKFKMLT